MSEVRDDKALSDEEREAKEKKRLHRLGRRSSVIKPKVWIGKTGVSKALVAQLNRQLKSDRLVKVKVQKSVSETQEMQRITREVAFATDSSLVDVRGRTFTLYKKDSKNKMGIDSRPRIRAR
jgi:putative YhbY family RNA-binding protein